MQNIRKNEVLINYYLDEYVNTIRYILTFDDDINSKYNIYIENRICDSRTSELMIRIMSDSVANNFDNLVLNKSIKANLPIAVAYEIVNEIRKHFSENHYLVYSSINVAKRIQTLQNERFTFNVKLNDDVQVEEAIEFNNNINSNDRHATKVLKLI